MQPNFFVRSLRGPRDDFTWMLAAARPGKRFVNKTKKHTQKLHKNCFSFVCFMLGRVITDGRRHSRETVGEQKEEKIFVGDGGYRSPYLSHAKRALYHLSYVPLRCSVQHETGYV